MGLATLTLAETLPLVGPPFRESLPKVYADMDVERAITLYRDRYEQSGWLENELYDGVADSIKRLHLQGFTIALCTSKPRVFAEKIISHFELTRFFDGIHGPELDGRFDRKDDLLTHLLARYGVVGSHALMIGDRDKDIHAATHAQTRSLGVLWGFGSHDELTKAGAQKLIEHPLQLQHIVHTFD